jgi:enamine deaminase RidA (YjgF/YER057c/UK114 family)
MSQAVVAGGCCYISLQTAPKPRHSTTPGKSLSQQPLSASGGYAAAIDYRAESEALLGELQRLLSHSGTDKRWLLKVGVLVDLFHIVQLVLWLTSVHAYELQNWHLGVSVALAGSQASDVQHMYSWQCQHM